MTFQSGKNEFAETTVLTLEDLMARISVAPSLNDRQRRDISSALNTVGRWHQRPLSEIPATHQYLRDFFESANFGSLGVSRGRTKDDKS